MVRSICKMKILSPDWALSTLQRGKITFLLSQCSNFYALGHVGFLATTRIGKLLWYFGVSLGTDGCVLNGDAVATALSLYIYGMKKYYGSEIPTYIGLAYFLHDANFWPNLFKDGRGIIFLSHTLKAPKRRRNCATFGANFQEIIW